MFSYLLKRLGTFVPTFIGVSIVTFLFIRLLPGDPIKLMAGERGMSGAALQRPDGALRLRSGRLLVQYWDYLTGILQGDLGISFVTKKPVWDEFFALFPATLELSLCAMVLAVVLGLPAGIIAAVNRGKWPDQLLMSTALVGYSMPIFWWALLLIIFFSGMLGWTPVSGRISLTYFFPDGTGFMLVDALQIRSARRLHVGRAASHPAGDRARHDPAGGDREADTFGHARGAR